MRIVERSPSRRKPTVEICNEKPYLRRTSIVTMSEHRFDDNQNRNRKIKRRCEAKSPDIGARFLSKDTPPETLLDYSRIKSLGKEDDEERTKSSGDGAP